MKMIMKNYSNLTYRKLSKEYPMKKVDLIEHIETLQAEKDFFKSRAETMQKRFIVLPIILGVSIVIGALIGYLL